MALRSKAGPALIVTAMVVALALLGGGLAWYRWRGAAGPEPLRGPDQLPAPALAVGDDPTRGELLLSAPDPGSEPGAAGGGADTWPAGPGGPVVAGPEVAVDIEPPAAATEMQIGFDPTFASTPWQPVDGRIVLRSAHQGHQMVFGRFRVGPGAEPGSVSVAGVTFDATYGAATASAVGLHRVSHVRPLSADVVVVRIEAGRLARGAQESYDFSSPPPGDDVGGRDGQREVEREGRAYGRQVAGSDRLLRPYDQLIGRPLDTEALLDGVWSLDSPDDPAYRQAAVPVGLQPSSRPLGVGEGPDGELIVPMIHDIVVRLPRPLELGRRYRLEFPPSLVDPFEWVADPLAVSPSIHVNQNGHAPGDGLKVGYLSAPPPSLVGDRTGLGYRAGMGFQVVDAAAGTPMATGVLSSRPGGDELGQGDLTGSAVFEADFSALTRPGRYRLCVDGVGCSEEFAIGPAVWRDLAVTVSRAMYHQRSGLALGPPYTSVARPRPYHPDDGVVVNESGYRLLDATTGDQGSVFAELVTGRRPATIEGAWGGHFDAGDWDRRIQHLYYTRAAAQVVELRPEVFDDLDLGIPESGDRVPDLLDEGLWTLDLFRRLQRADGAVRGGIEASEHPQWGTTSWSDDLALFAFDPDPWASYLYAGVAAETATVLERYDSDRARRYLDSAIAAMEWAESEPEPIGAEEAETVRVERSVAAAALFKATGEERWHQLFRDTTTLAAGVDGFLSCHAHGVCDAAWIYWTIDPALTDPVLRETVGASFVATAEGILAGAAGTAFGWTVENTGVPLIWGLGVNGGPNTLGLLRAHHVSGDPRFLEAAQRSAAVSLGANPLNTALITGVGQSPVRHPLIVDTNNGGLPVWAGTPVYGHHRLDLSADDAWIDDFVLGPAGTRPLGSELPYMWQWFDVSMVAQFNEYTVFQSHADALHAFGLLS